jgi:hypothetical protein
MSVLFSGLGPRFGSDLRWAVAAMLTLRQSIARHRSLFAHVHRSQPTTKATSRAASAQRLRSLAQALQKVFIYQEGVVAMLLKDAGTDTQRVTLFAWSAC